MKVLITGVAGQVGRALLQNVPADAIIVGLTHQQLDITEEHAVVTCLRQHRPDLVVNTAAYTDVERAELEEDVARHVNAKGPRHLALAARETGARLVHISTDFVFDGAASTPYRPDAQTNPVNIYGLTKREGEKQVLQILPERSVILRSAWIYAPVGRNFLTTMLQLMANGKPVSVVADQIGTPTAARSIADIIWKLAQRPQVSGIHHWSDAGVASWYDFAIAIAEESAHMGLLPPNVVVRPISTAEYPTRARRPGYSVLDKSSTIAGLDMMPIHWRESLRNVLREVGNA